MITTEPHDSYRKLKLPQLPDVPALTTDDERLYLYWCATQLQGLGAVVELGTWYGASAIALAAGLRDAHSTTHLYCIDRFKVRSGDPVSLPQESDTTAMVRKVLEPLYPHITLVTADLARCTWHQGPIELMHLDAPKRWSDVKKVLEIFCPFLIPGVSIIVAQDFCMPRAYAVPLLFGAYADSFKLLHVPSPHSTMAVFLYEKQVVFDEYINQEHWNMRRASRIIERTCTSQFTDEQQTLLRMGLAHFEFSLEQGLCS